MKTKILIIIGSNVGDTICVTPAVSLLRKYLPEAKIGLVTCSEVASQVFQDNPNVDQIYTCPKEIKTIAQDYKIALDLHNSPVSKHYIKQLPIPCFITPGPNPLHLRDHPLQPIYQVFPDCKLSLPERYDLYIRDEHHVAIQKILREQGADFTNPEILIGVHIGCGKVATRALKFWKRKIVSSRTWPFENFRKLYDDLRSQNHNIKFVFTGTRGEHRVVKKYFKDAPGVIDLTDKTSLHELAALMSYCRVFLSGDTGPMHVACCTNVTMVSLFGSTTPEVTGPYPMRKDVTCLQGKNIKDISVEQVIREVKRSVEMNFN